jgi:FKBP-type peptidyl-prolyl cis-trans isomerase FkpA
MTRVTSHAPRILVAIAAALLIAACGSSSPSTPSNVFSAPYSQTDLLVGTGAVATAGRSVTVNYTGWLYNPSATDGKGTQFDTSLQAGREPLSFIVGSNQVIAGFSQGVAGMRVGGKRRIVIPASLAYGSQGNGPVPPNATIVFEVDLLAAS